jgi:hypothetical protein
MYISIVRAVACAVLYAVMENRYFFEGQDGPWFGQFKRYHLLMFLLFAAISLDPNPFLWLWLMMLMPLIQDSLWLLIERRKLKRDDWSNFGKLPLVHGVYAWYIIEAVLLAVYGMALCYFGWFP